MGHPSGGVVGLGSLRDERLAVVHVTNTKTRKPLGHAAISLPLTRSIAHTPKTVR